MMKMLKGFLLGLVLLVSSTVFSQKLLPWQQDRMAGELSEMTEVMALSEAQVARLTQIKKDQAHAAISIARNTKADTKESRMAWNAHDAVFYSLLKGAVHEDQWKKWSRYVRESKKNSFDFKKEDECLLSKKAMSEVNAEVARMEKVMSLTKEQVKVIRELKMNFAVSSVKIYQTMEVGEEREQLWHVMREDTNRKIRAVTSQEQMKLWWESESNWHERQG